LYAVSDKGYLYKFDLVLKNNKIKSLTLKDSIRLKDKNHKPLKKKKSDAEGLFYYNSKLFISFERKHRVMLYDLDANAIKKVKINNKLIDEKKYKSSNDGLESVAYSKVYGVVTAPEEPFNSKKLHTIYMKDNSYSFVSDGKITALEFRDKHKLLILLRKFNYLSRRREIFLRELNLKKCYKNICDTKLLFKLDSKKGCNIDNFEGLTKISKNIFLMVSDDNDSFLQNTHFVLFKIKE
jgi:hypothetical protein